MRIFPIPQRQCCESAMVYMRIQIQLFTSMRIRIQGAKPMRADPCWSGSWSNFAVTKSCRKYSINHTVPYPTNRTKAILKGWKSVLFVNSGPFLFSLLADLIPDPHSQYGSGSREQNQCGSGSATLPTGIHKWRGALKSEDQLLGSVGIVDPWHFGTDQGIHTTDLCIRIRIRILLFSSVTFKKPTKIQFFPRFVAYYFLKVHLH